MKEFLIALLGGRGDLDAWLECNNEQECRDVIIPIVQQRDELFSIVKDMRNAKSEVFSMSPEGRKYLAKMDAAIAKCEA